MGCTGLSKGESSVLAGWGKGFEYEMRGRKRISTLPLLFSIHIAFFFWSMQSGPATTEVIVEGGVWRSPGPSLSGRDGFDGMGRTWAGMTSPGSTSVWVAIGRRRGCFSREASCL